jgi:serine-type D-Ala-D-Ala carboxypeptidase/endopeptidase (penicillin-binding protein 4)
MKLKLLASHRGLAAWRLNCNGLLFACAIVLLSSCTVRKTTKVATPGPLETLINDSSLQTAHVGVAVYDPEEKKYLYDYQGDKYFVPASNTKIPTLYAALKYLGDSVPGLRYFEKEGRLYITATGDPTLLHRDYKNQPVFGFLKESTLPLFYIYAKWQSNVYGSGWAWNDYNEAYMAERSELPIYGNTVKFSLQRENGKLLMKPDIHFFRFKVNEKLDPLTEKVRIERRRLDNIFDVSPANTVFRSVEIPFRTYENARLLEDTLKKAWLYGVPAEGLEPYKVLYSQHLDSVLKPLMHRSDNFFAEQMLLMSANEFLGVMDERRIIDTILKTDFKDLPQRPRWADGSGLSRYNLFSPKDFVMILDKMKTEFGMERLQEIFPTGNEGTLTNYYKDDSTFIYAKTGTLSGVVALSGYMYKLRAHHPAKMLIFSVLVNNHQASATEVSRAVEKFIQTVRQHWEVN